MSMPGAAVQGRRSVSQGPQPRPGKAVRVVLFFAYFFVFVFGLPFATVALVQAKYGLIDGPSLPASPWAIQDGRFIDGSTLLGATGPTIDIRTMLPFAKAAVAAAGADGTLALAVETASAGETGRAAEIIGQHYRITIPDGANGRIDPENFWHGRVRRDDRHLLIVLTRDEAQADRRIAATAGLPTPKGEASQAFGDRVKTATKYGIFVWAGLQFFIFGRVASWVSQAPAVPGVEPVAVETLMQRLLGINDQNVPYTISRGSHANEIVVDWRYADATWLDLMRVHGMKKGYRLVFRFDERTHNVRAQDRYASFDWSAGGGPDLLSLDWKVWLGITFYEYQHERVFGLQFKDGKPTFDLSYAYTFNLNELKQPMIEIIRHSGWNFRPVITFFRPVGG